MDNNAVELLTELMAANAQENANILTDIYVAAEARSRYLFTTIRKCLDSIPEGGTTAEYEFGLSSIEKVLWCVPEQIEPFRVQIRKEMGVE